MTQKETEDKDHSFNSFLSEKIYLYWSSPLSHTKYFYETEKYTNIQVLSRYNFSVTIRHTSVHISGQKRHNLVFRNATGWIRLRQLKKKDKDILRFVQKVPSSMTAMTLQSSQKVLRNKVKSVFPCFLYSPDSPATEGLNKVVLGNSSLRRHQSVGRQISVIYCQLRDQN